jgi:starch-binding outer membrane protein SusE/F
MRSIINFIFLIAAGVLFFAACDKAEDLPLHNNGQAPVLSASSAVIAPAPADSNNTALTLSWTSPNYATDTATYKFVIEMDSTGKNFANPDTKTVTGKFTASFIAKELNSFLLARGYAFNVPVDMDVRLKSSYANNNELKISNVVKIKMTPYKIPPKISPPTALYLVGDVNGWNNSATLDKRYYFYKTDETTFAGVFNFTSGGEYKLIQTLGDWASQYHMISGGTATAGQFEQKDASPAFPNPAAGSYRIVVDFQNASYTATKTDAVRVTPPADLYIVGDVNGWNNSASLDTKYKFTKVNDFVFTINVDFAAGGGYKLIQTLGDWSTQFHMLSGGTSLAGEFEQKDANPGFSNPTPAGTYKITVNFATMTYTVTKL